MNKFVESAVNAVASWGNPSVFVALSVYGVYTDETNVLHGAKVKLTPYESSSQTLTNFSAAVSVRLEIAEGKKKFAFVKTEFIVLGSILKPIFGSIVIPVCE